MATPNLGSDITETQLQIEWTAMTEPEETGNSDIIAYELYWDAQTGITDVLLVSTTQLSHI